MGAVFVAEHPQLGRKVAIKVLHPGVDRNPEVVYRFFNEAKAATEIRNEHIVEVLDFGELPDGVPYLVMEWLEGQSLGDALKTAPRQSVARTASVVRGIAQALKAAHAKGVIHRDLKPDNVFLLQREGAPDFVKVLDFGIAKLIQASDSNRYQTQTGAIIGTPAYMSPEQCRGAKQIDTRTDVYSLGVIAYQMLTGRLPFAADALGELLFKHLSETPAAPIALRPDIPPAISDIVARTLEKEPDKRPTLDALWMAMDPGGGNVSYSGPVSFGASGPVASTPGAGVTGAGASWEGSLAGGTLVAPGSAAAAPAVPAASSTMTSTTLGGSASELGIERRLGGAGRRRGRAIAAATAGAVVAVTAVVIVVTTGRRGDAPPPAASTSGATAVAPPVAPATNPRLAVVRVEIRTEPVTARLELDGVLVPNPFVADRTPDDGPHKVVATLSGFGSIEQPLALDRDRTLVLKLVPVPVAPTGGAVPAAAASERAQQAPARTPRPTRTATGGVRQSSSGQNAGTGGQPAGYHGSTKLKIETDFP